MQHPDAHRYAFHVLRSFRAGPNRRLLHLLLVDGVFFCLRCQGCVAGSSLFPGDAAFANSSSGALPNLDYGLHMFHPLQF